MDNIDKYIGFEYNGVKVNMGPKANIKGFIINEGEDLKFPSLPSFSNEFAFPKFGEISYFLGTTKENRTIGFTVALHEVTIQQYRNFLSQLSSDNPNYSNILKFDYNEYFGYKVKLNSISEGKFVVSRTCVTNEDPTDLYYIELDLEFVTYNDWAAQYLNEYEPIIYMVESEDTSITFADLFTFAVDYSGSKIEINNGGTLPIYLKITFTGSMAQSNASTFTIEVNEEEWITFPRTSNSITVFTKFGLVWDNNSNSFLPTTESKGAIEIPSGEITTITFTSSDQFDFSSITVEAILREII